MPPRPITMESAAARRQRDAFPLPLFSLHAADTAESGRSVRRRLLRKNHWIAWANDGIATLNRLVGHAGSGRLVGKPPAIASDISARLGDSDRRIGVPPVDLASPEGALRALLGGSGFYDLDRQDLAQYSKDLVSWPSCGAAPVELVSALPEPERSLLINWDCQLRRSESSGIIDSPAKFKVTSPYCDRELFRSPRVYGEFLTNLSERNMIQFDVANGRKGLLGIFLVKRTLDKSASSSTPVSQRRFYSPA